MSVQKLREKIDFKTGNPSGLKPVGKAVLVKPYELQKVDSLLVLPASVKDRQRMIEDRAVVVAIGPSCWDDEATPRAVIGDRVMISKFAGTMATGILDGETYRVINDKDIYLQIDVAEHLEK